MQYTITVCRCNAFSCCVFHHAAADLSLRLVTEDKERQVSEILTQSWREICLALVLYTSQAGASSEPCDPSEVRLDSGCVSCELTRPLFCLYWRKTRMSLLYKITDSMNPFEWQKNIFFSKSVPFMTSVYLVCLALWFGLSSTRWLIAPLYNQQIVRGAGGSSAWMYRPTNVN